MGWLGIRWVGGRLVREMRGEINDLSVVFFFVWRDFLNKTYQLERAAVY